MQKNALWSSIFNIQSSWSSVVRHRAGTSLRESSKSYFALTNTHSIAVARCGPKDLTVRSDFPLLCHPISIVVHLFLGPVHHPFTLMSLPLYHREFHNLNSASLMLKALM